MADSSIFPENKNILFCCLNWGLGHATRSIPLIQQLINRNNKIIIASDGHALTYLQNYFPNLSFYQLPAYNIRYHFKSTVANMLWQSPKILMALYKEKQAVKNIVNIEHTDIVISDNRPGCRGKVAKNIFMTHQISPYHTNKFVHLAFKFTNEYYIKKFNEIWVPDFADRAISGELSLPSFCRPPVYCIGPLSRMKPIDGLRPTKITFLLSGPEPQRTELENLLYKIALNLKNEEIVFVRGSYQSNPQLNNHPHLQVIDMAESGELNILLNQSKLVICRSGYSTLMDLLQLNKKAIVIPTPGQTEQEYLALFHKNKWPYVLQSQLNSQLTDLIYSQI